MPFTYSIPSADRIVFTRKPQRLGQFIFIFMGFICCIVGYFMLLEDDPSSFLEVMRYFLPVFGVIAVYIGFRLPIIQSKNIPDQIIFDNANGRIEVLQNASDIKIAYMYYDEVEDFIIKAKSQGSASTRTSRTRYTYHVYLLKKDGAEWELLQRNLENNARKDIDRLKSLINFSANPNRVDPVVHSSRKYAVSEDHHRTELSWRNKLGTGPFVLTLFTVGFIAVAYAIAKSDTDLFSDMPFFASIIFGFMGLIFVLVVVGNAMKMVKNARTIYSVSITNSSLDYFEKDLGGRIRKNINFPFQDLHSISFSFDTEKSMRKIFIYTRAQFEKKKSMRLSLSIDSIREMFDFYKKLVSLELQDLTAVEALQIENFLQQKIKEKGNVTIV